MTLHWVALIERLTDRRSDDLVPKKLADGSEALNLKGRFQQAPLARFIDGDLAMVQCVNSVEEANTFFGRNLLTGAPLSRAASDVHSSLIEEALLHGMSVDEYQFYGDLIEQNSSAPQRSGSTITIVNNDGALEGFNSTDAQLLPAPGNDSNANLGEQRLALFNAAAQIWGAFLDSNVTIKIGANFDSLSPCNPSGGVLGSAGSSFIFRDFLNAEFDDTWYHSALADKQRGLDLNAPDADVNATFNSRVDTGCLGHGTHFYYGLDNATPSGTINLFVVLLHEMGHGLGSSSFTDGTTGAFVNGFPDIWASFLYDSTADLSWLLMNDSERQASAIKYQ